jgi:hypothetical protein
MTRGGHCPGPRSRAAASPDLIVPNALCWNESPGRGQRIPRTCRLGLLMRLVRSSVPGAVERDAALRLLSERAVRTRALCRELVESKGHFPDRRASTVLSSLLSWIVENFPESVRAEPRPSDGLDQMVVPEEGRGLLAEIREGAQVGEAFFMLMTADNSIAAEQDKALLQERLESYWTKHAVAVRPPWFVDGKWPSSKTDEVSATDS